MSKRYTANTNQQGHQTYENNQTRLKPEVVTQLVNEMRTLQRKFKHPRFTKPRDMNKIKQGEPKWWPLLLSHHRPPPIGKL